MWIIVLFDDKLDDIAQAIASGILDTPWNRWGVIQNEYYRVQVGAFRNRLGIRAAAE